MITKERLREHELWLKDHTRGKRLVLKNTELADAKLDGADLSCATMTNVTFRNCSFEGTNFTRANLRRAKFFGDALIYVNFSHANLQDSIFVIPSLTASLCIGTNFDRSDLKHVNLWGTDLKGARLKTALLKGVCLAGALNVPKVLKKVLNIVPKGPVVGYKKCRQGTIVKLLILPHVRRSNANTRKCRAESAFVLKVYNTSGKAYSIHSEETCYEEGTMVYADSFDPNPWRECSNGIHFFLTRQEAKDYY